MVEKGNKSKAAVETVSEGPKPMSVTEFFEAEDEIAKAMDITAVEKQTQSVMNQMKDEMNRIGEKSTEEEKHEFKKSIGFLMMQIRRMNRLAQYRNKLERDKVTEERQKVDGQYLQLNNVIHEVQHLKKEVQRCLEFKSAHEKIELVSKEEFYKKAPKRISKPDITKNDSHQLRLAQLSWELEERKKLETAMGAMSKDCDELMQLVKDKKKQLNELKPKIDKILEASRPIQVDLDMKYEEEEEQRKLSAYLHKPLFYLFLQARAYQEILGDDMKVVIGGKLDAAKSWKEPEADYKKVEEKEEDEGKRSKGKRRRTVSDHVQQEVHHLLQAHPLHVNIIIDCQHKNSVVLTVQSLPLLKAVCVSADVSLDVKQTTFVTSASNLLSSNCILTNLYPNDDGTVCPNSTGAKKLQHFGVDIGEHVKSIGHLYKWVQTVCGMKSWGSNLEHDDQIEGCNFLQDVVARIRHRIKARISLQAQIASFENLAVAVPKEAASLFPSKILCRLTSWKSLTYEDFKCHPATQVIGGLETLPEQGWYFSCNIERGQAKLVALLHVGIAYPHDPPLFVLLLKWKGTRYSSDYNPLRLLEEKLNVVCPDEYKGNVDDILSVQMQMLLSRLDILLEVEADTAFPREHLFHRKTRGPIREFPMNYDPNTNSFHF